MSVLDLIPDFGERIGPNGEPVDEFMAVLAHMPDPLDTDVCMIAAAICDFRLRGHGNLARALKKWRPTEGSIQ